MTDMIICSASLEGLFFSLYVDVEKMHLAENYLTIKFYLLSFKHRYLNYHMR